MIYLLRGDNMKNMYVKIGIALTTILIIVGVGYLFLNKKEDTKVVENTNDINVFKKSYEKHNGEPMGKYTILPVEVNKDAIVKISTPKEIIEVLENEKALIYFGFETCPWCRNMLEAFTDAAANKKETIYYVDILDIRSNFKVKDGKLEETKGTDEYYKILKILDSILEDYIVYDDKKVEYKTGEKRLFAPTVVSVKDNEIINFKIGTLDGIENPFEKLTDEEYDELYNIYIGMINELNTDSCGLSNC